MSKFRHKKAKIRSLLPIMSKNEKNFAKNFCFSRISVKLAEPAEFAGVILHVGNHQFYGSIFAEKWLVGWPIPLSKLEENFQPRVFSDLLIIS